MALASEVGELCAVLRWAPSRAVENLESDPVIKVRIADEIGDVGVLLHAMCNRLGLAFEDVVIAKLEKNERNYPARTSQRQGRPPLNERLVRLLRVAHAGGAAP